MSTEGTTQIHLSIRRFNPGSDATPRWQEFGLNATPGMTVLDALWMVKETQDSTLTWRFSCRMGICGSCGMMINGSPRLACNTQISELGSSRIAIAPLPNFAIIRDLVPDLTPMFDSHTALLPHLLRDDKEQQENPTLEYGQSAHELEQYLQFSYCIKCGCCMAACPTYATDPIYSGPMPLAQAHRYNADSRDAGFSQRKRALAGERGPWRCHYAGECSRVCPKGVDPAKAIQFMKRDLVLDYLRLRKKRCPAKTLDPPNGTRSEGIPEAPAPTI